MKSKEYNTGEEAAAAPTLSFLSCGLPRGREDCTLDPKPVLQTELPGNSR